MLKEFGYAVRTDNITSFPNNINSNSGSIIDYSISGDMVQKSENLFDMSNAIKGRYVDANGVVQTSPTSPYQLSYTKKIPILPNTTYTYSFTPQLGGINHRIHGYDINGNWLLQLSAVPVTSSAVVYTTATFTTPANCYFITINYVNDSVNNTEDIDKMLNIGDTALPYVPYNPTPTYPITPIEVGDKTENLFDKNAVQYSTTGYIREDGTLADNNNYSVSAYIEILSNTQYTVSNMNINGLYPGIGFYSSDKTFISGIKYNGVTELTFTTPLNCKYVLVSYFSANKNNVMLNLGSTALPYEPYGYKININTNNIYLNEPLYSIGDYKDTIDVTNKTLTRKIKKLVLTGDEALYLYNSGASGVGFRTDGLTDMLYNGRQLGFCSHFQPNVAPVGSAIDGVTFGASSNNIYFVFSVNSVNTLGLSDLSSITNWLKLKYTNGTPVIVYYVLATPTIENITIPSTLTNNIEGYLTQTGTPTPTNPIYPTYNGTLNKNNTYTITTNISTDNIIYTSEPIRKIGDYSDIINSDGSITRNIYKQVFTGNETILGQDVFYVNVPTMLKYCEMKCNYFPYSVGSTITAPMNSVLTNAGAGLSAWFKTDVANTSADFKQWITDKYNAGNPLTIWYILNTADTSSSTTITTPPTINTIKGINTINNNNTLSPSNIRLKYNKGDWLEIYYRQLDINNITSNTLPMYFNSDSDTIGSYNIKGDMNQNVDFINVLLSEPLNGIDTYKDTLNLATGACTRKIKKLVLDGTEDWGMTSGNKMNLTLTDIPSVGVSPICTHYQGIPATSYSSINNNEITVSIVQSENSKLALYDDRFTSKSDFLSYLAAQYATGTPVTVWYVLTTPTTETVALPSGMTGTIEGYTTQGGTPTPTNSIYPKSNGELITNTITTFPTEIDTYYGNKLTANIKGNMNQSGTPSPSSPIIPSECGNKTANLFDVANLSNVTWATQYPLLLTTINSLPNGVYTMSISFELTLRNDTTDSSVCGWYIAKNNTPLSNIRSNWNTASVGAVKTVSGTFTINDNNRGSLNALYLYGCGNDTYGATGATNAINIMLNEGSTALPYEPYGIEIPISLGGNNLFDASQISWKNATKDDEGVESSSTVSHYTENYTVVNAETTYTLSGTISRTEQSLHRIYFYDKDKNWISRTAGLYPNEQQFTTPTGCKYIQIQCVKQITGLDFMLNTGSEALPYEPYNRTTTPVYLGEVQTTRMIKKLVLTGAEDEPVRWIGSNAPYAYYYEPTIPIGKARNSVICSHVPFAWYYQGETPSILMDANFAKFYINFGKDTMDAQVSGNTVAGFKEYCKNQYDNGNPVTIYYVLNTAQTGIVNEPLRKIEDYADNIVVSNIPTITGSQQFDVNTTLKPSEVDLTYSSIVTPYYETPTPSNPIYPNECGDIVTTGDYSGYYKIPIELNNIYINNPLCAIGIYKDSLDLSTGVVTRNIGKYVLNGSENWQLQSINSYGIANHYIRLDSPTKTSLCSHYQSQTTVIADTTTEGYLFVANSGDTLGYFYIRSTIQTTSDFKTYLQQQYNNGTPVTIYYILATPTTETTTIPYTLTGTIDGYLIQNETPTPSNPIYPISNGTETKNLFDTNDLITGVLNTDGTVNTSNKNYGTTTYINIKSSIDYTISLISTYSGAGRLIRVCTYDVNKTFISAYNSSAFKNGYKSYTITTDNNAKYIRISVLLGELEEKDEDIFLIEGSVPSEHYEPYGYKLPAYTTNIYTKEPIRKIGNYSDVINSDGTVTRNIKKLVFDGTENWSDSTLASQHRYGLLITNTSIDGSTSNMAICSHYTYDYNTVGTGFNFGQLGTSLYIRDNTYTTLTAWTSFLQTQYANNTPVTVYYILATPTTETITNPNLPLLIDENTLDINTKLKPSEVTIGAKQWVNKVPKIYINNKWTYNWTTFRELVRSGKAQDVFPVGTILYDTWGDDTSTAFQIVSYNTHYNTDLYNEGYTNSVTLCRNDAENNVTFDCREAMMYVTTAMPAGGYKFTIPDYNVTYGGNKTYYFETTQEVPVGGQICLEWRYAEVPRTIRTYASNTSTTVLDSYGTSSSPLPEWNSTTYPNAIDLGTVTLSTTVTTGTYGIFNHIERAVNGSNNYLQSRIRQYMNGTTNWWTPQTIFDRPIDWNTTTLPTNGLLSILNTDLTNILTTPTITTTANNTFEYQSLDGTTFTLNSSYTINTDKLFLLSHTEVNLSANPNSGTVLDYYINADNAKRIKKFVSTDTNAYWFFRTPNPLSANTVRSCKDSGGSATYVAYGAYGCVPACVIQ